MWGSMRRNCRTYKLVSLITRDHFCYFKRGLCCFAPPFCAGSSFSYKFKILVNPNSSLSH